MIGPCQYRTGHHRAALEGSSTPSAGRVIPAPIAGHAALRPTSSGVRPCRCSAVATERHAIPPPTIGIRSIQYRNRACFPPHTAPAGGAVRALEESLFQRCPSPPLAILPSSWWRDTLARCWNPARAIGRTGRRRGRAAVGPFAVSPGARAMSLPPLPRVLLTLSPLVFLA
jgi:hypothetical protein